jgi:hypothetical protein
MPLIFIHGVNTRETDRDHHKNVAVRNELLHWTPRGPSVGACGSTFIIRS